MRPLDTFGNHIHPIFMPHSTTAIPGRIRNTASDERFETIVEKVREYHGFIMHFPSELCGSEENARKTAKRYQSAFGMYRARARKRTFLAQKQAGWEVNTLSYVGPCDDIEAQVHQNDNGYEVRLVLSRDLFKEFPVTDLAGNAIDLDDAKSPIVPEKAFVARSLDPDDVFASLQRGVAKTEPAENKD